MRVQKIEIKYDKTYVEVRVDRRVEVVEVNKRFDHVTDQFGKALLREISLEADTVREKLDEQRGSDEYERD